MIYPNPTNNRICIKGIKDKSKVELFSLEGRRVKSIDINNDVYLDLGLMSVIYIMKISSKKGEEKRRIIIK